MFSLHVRSGDGFMMLSVFGSGVRCTEHVPFGTGNISVAFFSLRVEIVEERSSFVGA